MLRILLYIILAMTGFGAYAVELNTCYLSAISEFGQVSCVDQNGRVGELKTVLVGVEDENGQPIFTDLNLTIPGVGRLSKALATFRTGRWSVTLSEFKEIEGEITPVVYRAGVMY
jgi:hypothetical protein